MEDYNEWRAKLGLSPQVVRYEKERYTLMLSKEAKHGLIQLAESFNLIYHGSPSIGQLIECIGQFMLTVTSPGSEVLGFMDVDGLNEALCFEQGKEDYIAKRPMSFETSAISAGRKRKRIFLEAYCRGYASKYIEDNSEFPPPFETTLDT